MVHHPPPRVCVTAAEYKPAPQDRAWERKLEGKIEQTQRSKVDNGETGKTTFKIGG